MSLAKFYSKPQIVEISHHLDQLFWKMRIFLDKRQTLAHIDEKTSILTSYNYSNNILCQQFRAVKLRLTLRST